MTTPEQLAAYAKLLFDHEVYDEEEGCYRWPRAQYRFSDEDFGEEDIQCGRCTNSARLIAQHFKGQVFGYSCDENPEAVVGRDCGGHDFAVVDGYLVDYWAHHFCGETNDPVLPVDSTEVFALYGPSSNWKLMYDYRLSKDVVEALLGDDDMEEFADAVKAEDLRSWAWRSTDTGDYEWSCSGTINRRPFTFKLCISQANGAFIVLPSIRTSQVTGAVARHGLSLNRYESGTYFTVTSGSRSLYYACQDVAKICREPIKPNGRIDYDSMDFRLSLLNLLRQTILDQVD